MRSGRVLRISVTDRCDLRCIYCMPEAGVPLVPMADMLSYEEIATVARAAMAVGVRRFRLTGGEPLARRGVVALVGLLAALGPDDLALTTNGLHLAEFAAGLKAAGLMRVTVSLDTLRRDRFEAITRRTGFDRIFAGLEAARTAGLAPIKINTVVIRGVNDDEILDFVRFARREAVELRFIELMPTSGLGLECKELGVWRPALFVKGEEVRARVAAAFGPLTAVPDPGGVAGVFALEDGTRLGFITPVSEPFCRRLRADAARAGRPAEDLPLRPGRDRPAPAAARGEGRAGRDRGRPRGGVRGQIDLGARRDRAPLERHVQDRRVTMKVGILTVSDKGARGEREDRSGPAVREMIEAAGGEVARTKIVPDERERYPGRPHRLVRRRAGPHPDDRRDGLQPARLDSGSDEERHRARGAGPPRSHAPGRRGEDADGHAQPGRRRHPRLDAHRQPPRERKGRAGEPGRDPARPAARGRHPEGRGRGVRAAPPRLSVRGAEAGAIPRAWYNDRAH